MAMGQDEQVEILSYTPAKKKEEEKEEVLSYTPAKKKDKVRHSLNMAFGPFGTFPQEEQNEPRASLLKEAVGLGEAAANIATGAVAFPLRVAVGLTNAPFLGTDKALANAQAVAGQLTYQPNTTIGREYTGILTSPFAAVGAAQDKAISVLPENIRSAAKISTDAIMVLAPIAKGMAKPTPLSVVKKSVIEDRGIPLKQKSAVVKAIVEAEKSGAKTAGDIPAMPELTKDVPPTKTQPKSIHIMGLVDSAPQSSLPEVPLPKYAGSINLERVGGDYTAKKLIADTAEAIKPALEQRKSGVKITWEETQGLADSLGLSVEDLMNNLRSKTKDLEAYVQASRDVLMTSAEKVRQAAIQYQKDPSEVNLAKYQFNAGIHGAIQLEVSSAASASGRTLNIHKKLSQAKDYILTKQWEKIAKVLGKDIADPEVTKYIVMLDEGNPYEVMRLLSQKSPATMRQKFYEGWMNSILSFPTTHGVNMTSNALTEAASIFETAGAAGLQALRHPINVGKRNVYFGEALWSTSGAFHGFREALRRAGFAWANGITESGVSKLEIPTKAIKGKKGEIIRIPSKALMVEDELAKGVIYTDAIFSRAYHKATKEGFRGPERTTRTRELIGKPTQDMVDYANKQALNKTFQTELGAVGKALTNLRRQAPGSEFIVPFMRTPANIVKYSVERGTLGLPRAIFSKNLSPDMKARLQFSSGLSTIAAVLLADAVTHGTITGGGPTNPNEKQALYRTGWQPYSVKIGDTYYSYSRLEPLAMTLGTIADFHEARGEANSKEIGAIVAKVGLSLKNNLLNKTFFTGISDIVNAIDDPERYGGKWLSRFAGSVAVPAVVAGTARAIDPDLRDARSLVDTIKSRVPGMFNQVPPRLTPTGEPVKRPGTMLSRLLSPVAISREIKDPMWDELNRIGVFMSMPNPRRQGEKLKPEEVREVIKLGGPILEDAIKKFISSPAYQNISDENKAKVIKNLITKYRSAATNKYLYGGK